MWKYIIKYILTLRYIKLLSYISAKHIQESRQESHKRRYTYYYGFQFIYGAFTKFILLILLGLIFNILPQILLVMFSFVSLRIWIGGLHFDSYVKCAYISLLTFIIVALSAKYIYLNQFVSMVIFLFIFSIILKYAPVEHPNRPLKNNDKIKFKLIALIALIVLFLVNIFSDNIVIKNSVPYGALLSGIISLPFISKIK